MEKESSTVRFSEEYQPLPSVEAKGEGRRRRATGYLCLLAVAILVLHSTVSVWYLRSEVQDLQKKILLLQLKAEIDVQMLRTAEGIGRAGAESLGKGCTEKERKVIRWENRVEFPGTTSGIVLCRSKVRPEEKKRLQVQLQEVMYSQLDGENAQSTEPNTLSPASEDATEPEEALSEEEPISEDPDSTDDTDFGLKRKREIRDYNQNSAEQTIKNDTESKPKGQKSAETSSSEKSFELSSKEKALATSNAIYPSSTRKPHLHRKHRKSRIGSAERFFTETHSTTSTPIQVRQSRTKLTQSHGIDKTLWLQNQKFQQHTSPLKDTITKEEALRKGLGRHLEDVGYDLEASRERGPDALSYNMITIHFSADTSHYSRERDPHYFGNGRMQIKSEVYKDWKPAHWTQGVGMTKYFHLHQGRVTVSTTGIYLIYAQIQYSNVQEVNGFSVFRNKEVVVQCITTSTHPDKHEIKSNTCGISTTILLQSNDSVCIKDLHHGRYVVLTPEKSYFGLVLLSPFKN